MTGQLFDGQQLQQAVEKAMASLEAMGHGTFHRKKPGGAPVRSLSWLKSPKTMVYGRYIYTYYGWGGTTLNGGFS